MLKSLPLTSALWASSLDVPMHASTCLVLALSSAVSGGGGLAVHPAGKSACTNTSFCARAVSAAGEAVVVGAVDAVVVGADVVLDELLPPPPQAASTSVRSGAMRTSRIRTAGNPTRSGSPSRASLYHAAL